MKIVSKVLTCFGLLGLSACVAPVYREEYPVYDDYGNLEFVEEEYVEPYPAYYYYPYFGWHHHHRR